MTVAAIGTRRTMRGVRRWTLLSLVVVMLVTACGGPALRRSTGTIDGCIGALGSAPSPLSGVLVEPDDGRVPVLDELNAARCTIDLTIYLVTDDEVITALGQAVERGVRVRVM